MWDVLSGDFDRSRSGGDCLKSLQKLTRPGSIVVFHDSDKAAPRLLYALPEYLKWLKNEGYNVKALPDKTPALKPMKWSGGHASQAKVGLTDSL
jgi:hypothetical protein